MAWTFLKTLRVDLGTKLTHSLFHVVNISANFYNLNVRIACVYNIIIVIIVIYLFLTCVAIIMNYNKDRENINF